MNRRSFLTTVAAGTGTALTVSLAGCNALQSSALEDLDEVQPDRQLPVPTLGDGDVTVDVYEDLGCPACHQFQAEVFPVLAEEYIESDEISYRHYDFPVGAADESVGMANAARAVQSETHDGEDDPNGQFFGYKSAVIASDDWSDDALAELAGVVDVDPDVVSSALEDETYYPTIVADRERGEEAGVEGTPTVIVDGTIVDDPLDSDAVVSSIESA
ncbi:thioredoxin domain-containing protein [Natronobacterium texcoconense]|uniref:Protein-disulfide isomerase n=1 Tax=Natronobacterium texcoconense TaxID=1095778 RepID=A0A1H1BE96_NATTX|nr:thioredoxin domain-containing protein [Natronobacterium texcoconense]SDQ50227.1 Protein-disulfide isomerase [Natronobacterium texcoconense]